MRAVLRCVVAGLVLSGPLAAQTQVQPPAAPHEHGAAQTPSPPPSPASPPAPGSSEDHSAHQAPASPPAAVELPAFIPPLTDADRQAAFPDVQGHTVHDNSVNYFVLVDQLEGQVGTGAGTFGWDTKGWVGQDRNRLWFRAEGERAGGRFDQAQTNLLYGRAISRWWDVTAGVRLDTLPDTPRSALAVGLQGLAPYWFEVEASAYVETSGRTHVRVETAYDLLLTNRLVLQPLIEFEVYGRSDPERRIDAGLSTGELGLRLRYLVRREFAPYVGVVWSRKFFGTGDLARESAVRTRTAKFAVGLRLWL